MKMKTINKTMLNLGIMSLIFYLFLTPYIIYASPNHKLKRCNAFKYDENELVVSNTILLKSMEINHKESKTKKIIKLIHKCLHLGIDILSITNEIIDLQNN
jgi:hypothetical protein